MGPSAALARTWLRRNAASTVLLGVLVALVVGAAGGAFAGARRTASSLDRLLEHTRPPDAQVFTADGSSFDVDAVAALPQVTGWSTGGYGLLTAEGPGGGPFPSGDVNPFMAIDMGGDVPYRPYVVDGREPDVSAAHELAVDEEAARRLGAGVGDVVTLRLYTPDQMESLFDGGAFPPPEGARVDLTVTGIVRQAFDVTPGKPEDVEAVQLASSEVYPTMAFWDRYGSEMAAYGDGTDAIEVRLDGGHRAVAEFEAAVEALPDGDGLVVEEANDAVVAVGDARQAVRFEAVATALFGAVALLAGLVLVGQAISRQVRAELEQRDVLRAIGLSTVHVARAAALRMSVPVVTGALAGIAVAVASSAALPFGTAAKAEIDPGLRFDLAPLAATALVVGAGLVLWTARTARRAHAPADGLPAPTSNGRMAAAAAGIGAPVSVVFGLSQLGRRQGSTPVRSALGGVAFATAAVVAIGVCAATADRFVERPEEHGWSWDLVVGDSDGEVLAAQGAGLLDADPSVAGYASLWRGVEDLVPSGGHQLGIIGLDPISGDSYVGLHDGRPATGPDEVVLGERSMEQLDVEIGDSVALEGLAGGTTFVVVGSALLHQLLNDEFELAEGAVVTRAGLERISGEEVQLDRFIVDLEPGVDQATAIAGLREDFGPTVAAHVPPLDVASLDETRHLPPLLALVIGVVGGGSLVHLLLVTVRRRRVAFAVARALGARPAQVSAAVASMATATVLAAAVFGVPLGVVAGRSTWRLLAEGLGAATAPVVPLGLILGGGLLVVVVGNAVAAVPGRSVRRVPPAEALRAE